MNISNPELFQLIDIWLQDRKSKWRVVNLSKDRDTFNPCIVYGRPISYAGFICDNVVIFTTYIANRIIDDKLIPRTIYASDPEFFEKLSSTMERIQSIIETMSINQEHWLA
jgi:hypothetical protein